MIAQELEVSLHMAFVEARQKRHEFITVEHLLLALLDNPTAAEVLRACGANMDELRKSLTQHIAEQTPRIAADREVDTNHRQWPSDRCLRIAPTRLVLRRGQNRQRVARREVERGDPRSVVLDPRVW